MDRAGPVAASSLEEFFDRFAYQYPALKAGVLFGEGPDRISQGADAVEQAQGIDVLLTATSSGTLVVARASQARRYISRSVLVSAKTSGSPLARLVRMRLASRLAEVSVARRNCLRVPSM